jgi:ketosteroid isomerase-like protein
MTDRQAIRALIDRAYEARANEDIEAVMELFHPNGKFEIAGSNKLTIAAGTAHGHEELRKTLSGLIANFEFVQRELVNMVVDEENEQTAVQSRVTLRFIPKDLTATTDLLDLWKFENGKIVELIEFADTALVNDLMK